MESSRGKCTFVTCDEESTTILYIKRCFYRNPSTENSIAVCKKHADLCLDRVIPLKDIEDMIKLAQPNRNEGSIMGNIEFKTREEYMKKAIEEIEKSKTLRCVFVGPLPLHPDWYFELCEKETNYKSMDRVVANALSDKNKKVMIIFRNSPRYLSKVKSKIGTADTRRLVEYINNAFIEWSKPSYNNTLLIEDVGIFHIPIITDDVCIFASRTSDNSPVNGGILIKDKQTIDWEKKQFDLMVDKIAQVENQRAKMKTFIKKLL